MRSISALCEGLVRAGAQVTVFTTNANGRGKALPVPTNQAVEVDGVQVHYFPRIYSSLAATYYYSPKLRQACKEHIRQFDLVYVCGTWTYAMVAGARASSDAGVPFVVSPRGSFMTWSMSQKPLKKRIYLAIIERRLMDRALAIHCTSALEAKQTEKWNLKSRIVVIPNGLDMGPFQRLPQRGNLRQSLGIPEAGTLSLFVGRLHKEKRIDMMINAFTEVSERLPSAHLLIVGPEGDGSGKRARQQVRDLGVSDHIHFTGMLTGNPLMQAYADADLHVLLSHRESFGMVVAEAMAAGLPILIAETVGLAEEISQAHAGLMVSANSDELIETWINLLSKQELRRLMGEQGRILVGQCFSAEPVAARMLDFFGEVIKDEGQKLTSC